MNKNIGYFEGSNPSPAHDPGLEADCIVCMKKLERPLSTISLMGTSDDKSYFFRTHESCWGNLTSDEQSLYESSIIDNLE